MLKLEALPQFSRNARRFSEIVSILFKYGLANWIRENDPEFIKNLFTSRQGDFLSDYTFAACVRLALTELGTTFIKLGQILSTRADLIGPELAGELTELQANTPADPPEVVRETLEAELNGTAEELYAFFDFHALASASIGQVHLARLFSGQEVVVKIQHQGIEDQVRTDLDIMMKLAELAEKYDPEIRLYQPRALAAEFKRSLLRELDFGRERRNLILFTQNFQDEPAVHVPKPYPELSSRRVLTMEKLEGISVAKTERLSGLGYDLCRLTRKGAGLFMDMVFRDRFYHADPHPGNIWILADGRIALLDCGMVGRLDEETQEEVEGMLLAAIENDTARLTEHVMRICSAPQVFNRQELRADIDEFLYDFYGLSLKELEISTLLTGLTDIIRDHHLLLPSSISMLVRLLVMLEGTARLMDRNFNLIEVLEPYYLEAVKKKFSPDKLWRRLMRSYRDWDSLIEILPRGLADILERVSEGRFNVNLEHRHLDNIVNRLVYGLLTAALFLGSCQLIGRSIPPLLGGISILGLLGLIGSLGLGLRLLLAVKKTGSLGP